MAESAFAKTTIEAFIDCVDGNLSQPADSQDFFESLLGHDVSRDELRKILMASTQDAPTSKRAKMTAPTVGRTVTPPCANS